MTEWLLQEALAIRLENVTALIELHDLRQRELVETAGDLRRDAIAALDAG